MSTADNNRDDDIPPDICANCGKGEDSSSSLMTCTACKMVKYCSRDCQIAHRPRHKKECRRRAKELHDIELFKQPPQYDDCPICFERLPTLQTGWRYQPCCGKTICSGCFDAPVYDDQGKRVDEQKCAFCRTPTPESNEEAVKRLKKRFAAGDAEAIHITGCYYYQGKDGFSQDYVSALELWHRAGELGHSGAYNNLGYAFKNSDDVERDEKKAVYYWELAAMQGSVMARHCLGVMERSAGNTDRALKHFMIAARSGSAESLETIKQMYSKGHAKKEDYTEALRSYQEYLGDIKSSQRDKAAAAKEEYRYY